MAKQYAMITFDRNSDDLTTLYRVYRSQSEKVDQNSIHILDIKDPRAVTPMPARGEILTQISTLRYQTYHRNIVISASKSPQVVYVNDIEASSQGYYYELDAKNGIIKFEEVLPAGAVVKMDYWFDGMMFVDWNRQQDGVTYYGPEAQDLITPSAPTDLSIQSTDSGYGAVLGWDGGILNGNTFYYRVEATDEQGHYSRLSAIVSSFLQADGAGYNYLIERSMDQKHWQVIGKTNGLSFVDEPAADVTPNAVTALAASVVMNQNEETGTVTLKWLNPVGDPTGLSGVYRIRAISTAGAASAPSAALGPIVIHADVDKIVIRRKPADGNVPTYSGADAQTVAVIGADQTIYQDTPKDNQTWTYGVFRVNKTGTPSLVTSVDITLGDATPPDVVTHFTYREVRLVY